MIVAIAEQLGLQGEAGRHGLVGDNRGDPVRARGHHVRRHGLDARPRQAMLLTDAIYYDGNYITMKKDQPFHGISSRQTTCGHSVGTGTGYSYVPDIKKIPKIGEVQAV